MYEYVLYWQGEEIDSANTRSEAEYLRAEYALAFHCAIESIRIKKVRL